MCKRLIWIGAIAGVTVLSGIATISFAGDYYTSVPVLPAVKIGPAATGATPAKDVFGKEYSHTDWFSLFMSGGDPRITNVEDHDAFAAPDPLQVVSWDGSPLATLPVFGPNSGSTDGFDYSNDPTFNFATSGQVDALANRGDFLFKQVIDNTATLLFSQTADLDAATSLSTGPILAKAHVHWEAPVGPGAGPGIGEGVWAGIEAAPAGPGTGPGVNHHVVEDLDALEVWGPEPPSHAVGTPDPVREGYLASGVNTADADRFSLDVDSLSGVSVWGWDIGLKKVFPYIPHADIVSAVETLFFGGEELSMETRDLIDVDGTMVRDVGSVGTWDAGDELLFTIDPLDFPMDLTGAPIVPLLGAPIHGGEIMHLVNTGAAAFAVSFLSHGGHVWNSLFSPAAAFGYLFDDVDALEAVGTLDGVNDIPTPEPASLLLMLCGIAGFAFSRRRG